MSIERHDLENEKAGLRRAQEKITAWKKELESLRRKPIARHRGFRLPVFLPDGQKAVDHEFDNLPADLVRIHYYLFELCLVLSFGHTAEGFMLFFFSFPHAVGCGLPPGIEADWLKEFVDVERLFLSIPACGGEAGDGD